eukprot:CAMPEP_0113818544 /NCGR_PEP_ID=MMETSP0328-20130328/293_1 /TAXON_ID=39455 /ORGANISM="Alexandrium minutum" /LENGTH=428 /DNA_ID=CAMNT_0000786479 /DNA_START=152 /DNA_END=1438 /DNA_ORIENTATION=+ /assembly_acc=CAM_ASM_000350
MWAFAFHAAVYAVEYFLDVNVGFAFDHSKLVGHTLSFLLVFRANSSYWRYWQGRNCIAYFFANTRDLAFLSCTLFKGGHGQYLWNHSTGQEGFSLQRKRGFEDLDDQHTSHARTDVVRWCLALAVAFRIHMRLCGDAYYLGTMDEHSKMKLDWDRMRLRTLMNREEFLEVDRALTQYVDDLSDERQLWEARESQPQAFHGEMPWHVPGRVRDVSLEPSFAQILVVLNFVTQSVRLHAGEPYGYKERFLPEFIRLINQVLMMQDRVNQAMTTPLPLPYVNLVRTLLVTYLFSVPFFTDYSEGLWANVGMPTVTALALLGIDQIGGELENPFGEDANDLDVQEMIMTLEKELMRLLELSGDAVARDKFTWVPAPKFMQEETERPFLWYLALRSEIAHLEVPKCRGSGGLWVRHVVAPGPRQREQDSSPRW